MFPSIARHRLHCWLLLLCQPLLAQDRRTPPDGQVSRCEGRGTNFVYYLRG
ncbi:MAG: hypothetical protein IPK17_19790 [Chloroflexi bacterium]|uniref:hypothetical protein n=1 Tax=Candidatus Flexifilum breve TaxID=3140694 RepID=UPI003134ED1E|nr:hypothetical protein [Chloroflexota bacterium]